MPRPMSWLLMLGALLASSAAAAAEPWAAPAVDCLKTIDGFNEGREWAQYRVTPDEVRVLVQSGGEDWVFVELICQPGGSFSEGPRHTLPRRVTGSGTRPPEMLGRGDFSAQRLEQLVRRARDYAHLPQAELVELSASYVDAPRPRTVYRAALAQGGAQRSVEFDDGGKLDERLALRPDELADAPEPETPGAPIGLEKLTDDPVKVAEYLSGALGATTRINRFIVDPRMLTVEWVAPDTGKILLNQWMIIEDKISAPDAPTPPNVDKVCAPQPGIAAVKDSLARLMAQPARAKRIRQSALLILECETAGKAPAWQLLGGDGKLEAGVPLTQEKFAF